MNKFMGGVPTRLVMADSAWSALLAHLQAGLPEEACGLLGGRLAADGAISDAVAQVFLPVENELHSPVRFRMNPVGMLAAFNALEAQGLELVGTAHSHPAGPRHPSPTDLAEFAYPGVLSLICVPDAGAPEAEDNPGWQVRAFWISDVLNARSEFAEVPITLMA